MIIVTQFISGFNLGFELLWLREIGIDEDGWILALNLGIFRLCFETAPS